MDFTRHVSHLTQRNKPHAKTKKVAGKVESLLGTSGGGVHYEQSKE